MCCLHLAQVESLAHTPLSLSLSSLSPFKLHNWQDSGSDSIPGLQKNSKELSASVCPGPGRKDRQSDGLQAQGWSGNPALANFAGVASAG